MQWQDIRQRHPQQWLLIEALNARSSAGKRIIEDMAVLDMYPDGMSAMNAFRELRRRDPHRELYVLHTQRETLEVPEFRWSGIRTAY